MKWHRDCDEGVSAVRPARESAAEFSEKDISRQKRSAILDPSLRHVWRAFWLAKSNHLLGAASHRI